MLHSPFLAAPRKLEALAHPGILSYRLEQTSLGQFEMFQNHMEGG